MIFTRFLSILLFFATFGVVVISSPVGGNVSSDAAIDKRADNADIKAILDTLKGSTDSILPQITGVIDSGLITELTLSPLFVQLTGAIDQATADIVALSESENKDLVVRQSQDEIAQLVASILTDITGALDGLVDDLATLPFLGILLGGLDRSLNQLLNGLENLLAGLLRLVAQLLEGVARLLRQLAFGLTLASLGL